MLKPLILTVYLLLIGAFPMVSFADEFMVNQDLQRAINELEAAKTLVNQAKENQEPPQRMVFDYKKVLSDINTVEEGLIKKLKRPKIQPRIIKPVEGDYLHIIGDRKR